MQRKAKRISKFVCAIKIVSKEGAHYLTFSCLGDSEQSNHLLQLVNKWDIRLSTIVGTDITCSVFMGIYNKIILLPDMIYNTFVCCVPHS